MVKLKRFHISYKKKELKFLSKSVRVRLIDFGFQSARHDEAWMVLRRVHDTNWKAKGEPERVFTVSC